METKEVFLEKNRSKFSVNKNSFINLDLENKSRLFPFNNISERLNLNQLYNDERDACKKYRMIFTVNPICSNVLFNNRTEIVRYEGSDNCTVLFDNTVDADKGNAVNTSSLNYLQAIRDTEYSHPDIFNDEIPYVYHCGADIFNNHLLRGNDFIAVNKISNADTSVTSITSVFNTIKDYQRNYEGKKISENVAFGRGVAGYSRAIHLYQYDTLLSMYDAFSERIKVKDGWYGFNNTTSVEVENATIDNKDISINKILNNNKACEFIDLYPDRSLFSFIPKLNKYKRRLEKNWDYCICYPKEKDSNKINEVCSISTAMTEYSGGSSVRIVEAKRVYSNSGSDLVRMKTMFKHTLNPGDYITLFYSEQEENSTLSHFNNRIRIVSVGDYQGNNKELYFNISYKDISSKFDIGNDDIIYFIQESGSATQLKGYFFYKKNINGVDCQYYFRKFAKITKNNDGVTDLTSNVGKLAYGENIYGDRVAQIVFTDDIDIDGLLDHRGKPLTELYFTVVKRNAGHNLWYDNNNFTADTIEFSHCFGEVTSGLDLPEECYKYNIRRLNNINYTAVTNYDKVFSNALYEHDTSPVERNLTISSYNDGVYGDIIEYCPVSDYEQVIGVVYHRFNTAQRETTNSRYSAITEDEIEYDDYDIKTDGTPQIFSIKTTKINKGLKINETGGTVSVYYNGNLNPEGYFYNPYTKIKIREESENKQKAIGQVVKYDTSDIYIWEDTVDGQTFKVVTIFTSIDYKIMKNDIIGVYNNETKELTWGWINDVRNNTELSIYFEDINFNFDVNTLTLIKTDIAVPGYATYLPSSHSFVWRDVIKMSELPVDSDIVNMPFVNGRNYIEKNVTFFLRRQDPAGKYGLLNFDNGADYRSSLGMYRIDGNEPIDLSKDIYNDNYLDEICY